MRTVTALIAMAACAGCTPTQRQPPRHDARGVCDAQSQTRSGEASARAQRPVITTLQTRNHEVTVYGGPDGLRFTVSLGETVLAHKLDERDFARSFPSLHRHFESAFADERWVDASAETPDALPGAWGGL